jgi:hypothetical protein
MQVILGTETEDYVSNELIFDLSIIFTAMIEVNKCKRGQYVGLKE